MKKEKDDKQASQSTEAVVQDEKQRNTKLDSSLIAKLAMLSAIAYVLLLIEFPIFPSATFLRFNISDMPALIGAFLYGPIGGIIITMIKLFLFLITGTSSAPGVGELANLIIGITFAGIAGWIYQRRRTMAVAILSLAISSIAMIIVSCLANLFILFPAFGIPQDARLSMVLTLIIPFNAIKAAATSIVTFFVYKPLHKFFNRF